MNYYLLAHTFLLILLYILLHRHDFFLSRWQTWRFKNKYAWVCVHRYISSYGPTLQMNKKILCALHIIHDNHQKLFYIIREWLKWEWGSYQAIMHHHSKTNAHETKRWHEQPQNPQSTQQLKSQPRRTWWHALV